MRPADILRMALRNMWQRRVRTILCLIGIVVGCTTLLMTAGGVLGIQTAFQAAFAASDSARQVVVRAGRHWPDFPDYADIRIEGEMNEARSSRIRVRLYQIKMVERFRQSPAVVEPITRDTMRQVEPMRHVQAVVTLGGVSGMLTVEPATGSMPGGKARCSRRFSA